MLTEIGAYLATQNIGTVGTDIFLGLMPDQPDNCIALFEYAGSPPDLHWEGEYPRLQVRVRDKSYAAARAKIGGVAAVSYTHLDVYKRQCEWSVLCVHDPVMPGLPIHTPLCENLTRRA